MEESFRVGVPKSPATGFYLELSLENLLALNNTASGAVLIIGLRRD